MQKKIVIPLLLVLLAFAVGGGWLLWQNQHSVKATSQKAIQRRQLYTCSMHPFIIREKPGVCPICGMELIKKIDTGNSDQPAKVDHLSLSPNQRVMANVATVEATMETLNKEINAVGIVQYDQSRQAKVTAWVAGRIDRLNVNSCLLYTSDAADE